MLTHDDKRTRVLWYWNKAWGRAKGAGILIKGSLFQNNRLFIEGYSVKENMNYIKQLRDKDEVLEAEV